MGDIYERRLTFGLVGMSLVPVVLAALGLWVGTSFPSSTHDRYAALIAVLFVYLFSAAATLVFMPVAFWLRRQEKRSLVTACGAGAAIWSLGSFALLPAVGALAHAGQALMLSPLLGSIGGLVYWAIAVRGQSPNNSFKPKPLRGSA